MTMRTFEHFLCPNGHKGLIKTSENDQPYSKMWERMEVTGMYERVRSPGEATAMYACSVCGLDMQFTK